MRDKKLFDLHLKSPCINSLTGELQELCESRAKMDAVMLEEEKRSHERYEEIFRRMATELNDMLEKRFKLDARVEN